MAIRPIIQDGNPILREEAIEVPSEMFGTLELQTILKDMADTLHEEKDGVAIAAPQMAIPYRIFIVRFDRTITPELPEETEGNSTAQQKEVTQEEKTAEKPEIGIFINPAFIKSSRKRSELNEGCLSVRGLYGTTFRNDRATVRAQGPDGKFFERGAGGLLAQIFQHEIDHLDGILFIDHAIDITSHSADSEIEHSEATVEII
jgi:peptide deformylase